jgi:hypothetical protein
MSNNLQDGSTIIWRKTCKDCGCRFEDSMTKLLGRFPVRVKDFKTDIGQCPNCRQKEKQHFDKLLSARDLHHTFETVKDYFSKNPPYVSQELLVLDTSWNLNTYALVTVVNPDHTKQKRIVIESYSSGYSGQSFYRSGKNCFSPKGQVRLLPYNSAIGDLIKKGNGKEIQLQLDEILDIVGEQP